MQLLHQPVIIFCLRNINIRNLDEQVAISQNIYLALELNMVKF